MLRQRAIDLACTETESADTSERACESRSAVQRRRWSPVPAIEGRPSGEDAARRLIVTIPGLGYRFVDTDAVITERHGPIPRIFADQVLAQAPGVAEGAGLACAG